MSNVLVPLDGSDKDKRAIPAAAAFADLAGGDLRLIRVLDTPVESLSPRARTMGVTDAAVELRGDIEQSVRGIADRLIADTGRPVTAEVAEGFDVAGVLVARAGEPGTDLVVMATRAAGALGRALRGSVADRVMRESPRPVVLVPPGTGDRRGKQLQLERVLVPLDGSAFALSAVDQLLELRGGSELEYVLLEVVTSGFVHVAPPGLAGLAADTAIPEAYSGLPDIARARAAAEERLNGVADRLRAQGANAVRVRVVEAADPAVAINRAVREERADFVAMSTRGLSGLKRFVLGSVAEKVVRESVVPVLLVTPR
jgi:nucleotide-binding universal stress UspA family protein